jgi:hypothetical protein
MCKDRHNDELVCQLLLELLRQVIDVVITRDSAAGGTLSDLMCEALQMADHILKVFRYED